MIKDLNDVSKNHFYNEELQCVHIFMPIKRAKKCYEFLIGRDPYNNGVYLLEKDFMLSNFSIDDGNLVVRDYSSEPFMNEPLLNDLELFDFEIYLDLLEKMNVLTRDQYMNYVNPDFDSNSLKKIFFK